MEEFATFGLGFSAEENDGENFLKIEFCERKQNFSGKMSHKTIMLQLQQLIARKIKLFTWKYMLSIRSFIVLAQFSQIFVFFVEFLHFLSWENSAFFP